MKNILQEFCQKHHNPLPIYKTNIQENGFVSTVIIKYKDREYSETSEPRSSKKLAEMNSAERMINNLDNIINDYIVTYNTNQDITILIDMENVHMGNFFLHKRFDNNVEFIGFSTENHPSIKVAPIEIKNIQTISSDRKDACDILMIGYAARNIDNMGDTIIILTKDHFGQGLVDYLNSTNNNKDIRCIKSIEVLEEYFSVFRQ